MFPGREGAPDKRASKTTNFLGVFWKGGAFGRHGDS